MNNLAEDLAVEPLGSGRYRLLLSDAWNFLTPSGGVLMGAGLRALEAEVADPAYRLASATAVFCEPVREGELFFEATILRRGGAGIQGRVTVYQGTSRGPGLEVSATFVRDRAGPDVVGVEPPKVASWADSRPSLERRVPLRFFEHFEDRIALGHLWMERDWEPREGTFARWLRFLNPPMRDGFLDPCALPAVADLMPPALVQMLGPKHPRFFAPSLDLTLHFLEPGQGDKVLLFSKCRRARAGYATAEVEVWSEQGRLLAYATQVMMLRGWPQ